MILFLSIKSFLDSGLYQTKCSLIVFALWSLSPIFYALHYQLEKIRIAHLIKKHSDVNYVFENDSLFLLRKDCKKFFLIREAAALHWIADLQKARSLPATCQIAQVNDYEKNAFAELREAL